MKFTKLIVLSGILIVVTISPVMYAGDLDNKDSRYPQRSYRRFLLPNQMKVMLISDPSLQRGAASMTVAVGSIHDPPEYQGLAHFMEHMLFLGTEKYPEGGSYQKFVSTHDGFSNAFTAEERTNYHFEIAPDHLDEALDRFSEFFVTPIFNPELIERELKAVDSEHSKNIPVDFRRINQLKREVYISGHPARHFSTGNMETLERVTRKVLLDFYHKEYSSNRMTLAVSGPQSLNTLQNLVARRFNRVENHNLKPHNLPEKYLTTSENFRLMKIKTVKDSRTLTLIFPLPSTHKYYQSRPLNMLGFLIGHEGRGSLLSLLKKEGMATGLSAGGGDYTSAYSSFEIKVQLTTKGLKRYKLLITKVFQYIRMLREKSLPPRIYQEVKRMAEIDYRFDEKREGTQLVNMFSMLMQVYPLRGVEIVPFQITKYSPRIFDSMLFRLTPDNMLVLLAAKDVKTDQVEVIYGTEYSFEESRKNFVTQWKMVESHPGMYLPKPNKFLPKSFDLLEFKGSVLLTYQSLVGLRREALDEVLMKSLEKQVGKKFKDVNALLEDSGFQGNEKERKVLVEILNVHVLGIPKILKDDSFAKIWYQQDFRFHTPKARLIFRVHSPFVYDSPRNAVLAQLYSDAITEDLNEIGYPIKMAGLEYSISVDKKGINLSFSGYSDRILELVKTVSERLNKIRIDQETFEALREKRMRRYTNFHFQQPYQQAFYYRSLLLEFPKHSIWDYEKVIRSITLTQLKKFSSNLYDRNYIEGFIYGNLLHVDANKALEILKNGLGGKDLSVVHRLTEKVIQIEPGKKHTLVKRMEIENSATVIEIQMDQTSPKLRSALMVLDTALQPLFYNELRTRQQLGYIVNSGMTELEKTLGIILLIQSGKYDAATLEKKIDGFLPGFLNSINEISEEELETLKESVINGKLQKTTSFSAESARLFNIAFEHDAHFDYNSDEIFATQKLKRHDLRSMIQEYFIPERQRSLVLRMVGKEHKTGPIHGAFIESPNAFRVAYPCPQSCLP